MNTVCWVKTSFFTYWKIAYSVWKKTLLHVTAYNISAPILPIYSIYKVSLSLVGIMPTLPPFSTEITKISTKFHTTKNKAIPFLQHTAPFSFAASLILIEIWIFTNFTLQGCRPHTKSQSSYIISFSASVLWIKWSERLVVSAFHIFLFTGYILG